MILNKEIANAFVSILDDCDTSFKDRLTCVPRTDEDANFVETFLKKLGIKYTVSNGVASTMYGNKSGKKTFVMEKTDAQPETSWNTLTEIFDQIQSVVAKNRVTIYSMVQDFKKTTEMEQKFKDGTDKVQTEIMAQRLYLDSLNRKKQNA